MEASPRKIVLISGKRKSGKDYVAEKLRLRLGNGAAIARISHPIKSEYATKHDLDLQELLSDTEYKEKHRKAMVEWSEAVRAADHAFFIRKTIDSIPKSFPIWIFSDIRRKTDMQYFESHFNPGIIVKIRITASDVVRAERGFVFQSGIDDAETECDLDEWSKWDFVIENNGIRDCLLHDVVACLK